MATVLVALADGFEEVEAIATIDVLRRSGSNVIVGSVMDTCEVTSQGDVRLLADKTISELLAYEFDAIVLPGGYVGVKNMISSQNLCNMILSMNNNKKIIAAICAAPLLLSHLNILDNIDFTCYPSIEEHISSGNYISDKKVVQDKNIITSQGPATALEFGFYIASILEGEEVVFKIKEGMLQA